MGTLKNTFANMVENGEFLDTEIRCKGGDVIGIHRVVLCMHSSYFRELFAELPECNNRVTIFAPDCEVHDVKNLRDYLYMGEMNLAPDSIEGFALVAQTLRIEELDGVHVNADSSCNCPTNGNAKCEADCAVASASVDDNKNPNGRSSKDQMMACAIKQSTRQEKYRACNVKGVHQEGEGILHVTRRRKAEKDLKWKKSLGGSLGVVVLYAFSELCCPLDRQRLPGNRNDENLYGCYLETN